MERCKQWHTEHAGSELKSTEAVKATEENEKRTAKVENFMMIVYRLVKCQDYNLKC